MAKLTKKQRRKTHWDDALKAFRVGPRAEHKKDTPKGQISMSQMMDLARASRGDKKFYKKVQKGMGLI